MRWLVGALSLAWVILAWGEEPVAPILKPLETMTDREKLFLIDRIPLGITRENLLSRMPDATDRKTEAGHSLPGPDAEVWSTISTLFGRPADIRFGFEDDTLYAFRGSLWIGSHSSADSLYAGLITIYSERYGKPEEEAEPEPDNEYRAALWRVGGLQVCVSRNRWADWSILGWSFQPLPKPQRYRRSPR